MEIIYEIYLLDGSCLDATPSRFQAEKQARARAETEGVPIGVARVDLRSGVEKSNIYHPNGLIERSW